MNKRGFTLVETLIATLVLALLVIPLYQYVIDSKERLFETYKENEILNLARNLGNKVTNLRDSAWVIGYGREIDPTIGKVSNSDCSDKLHSDFKGSAGYETVLSSSIYGWFCADVSNGAGENFADLNGVYTLSSQFDNVSKETKFFLTKTSNDGFSGYKILERVEDSRIKDFTLEKLKDFFDGRKENLTKLPSYDKYKTSGRIPSNTVLYTITFSDPAEADFASVVDLSTKTADEKQFFLNQTKKVKIQFLYSVGNNARKTYTVEKLITNFLN